MVKEKGGERDKRRGSSLKGTEMDEVSHVGLSPYPHLSTYG